MPLLKHRTLGPVCQNYRLQAGLSQLEVARHLGYRTPQIISNFERGTSSLPPKKLFAYAHLCKIPEQVVVGMSLADDLYHLVSKGELLPCQYQKRKKLKEKQK